MKSTEENFRVLFDENPLPTILSEMPTGVIAFVNKRLAALLGMDQSDIIGKTANDLGLLKNPGDQEKLTTMIAGEGYVDNVEIDKVFPGGGRGADLISMRLVTVDGKPYCLTVIQDITERKQAEEALRKSEERYRRLVETTDTGYVIIDNKGVVLDANPEYVRLSGHTKLGDILGRNVTEWTTEEEKEANARAVADCLRNGFVRNLEIAYVDKTGKRTPVEINATVIDTKGNQEILSLCRDISERRRISDDLRASEEKHRALYNKRKQAEEAILLRDSYLSAIIENQPGLLWLKDRDGKFLSVNAQFAHSCGLNSPESLVGKTDFDIWPHDLAARYVADDHKVIRSGKPCMVEEPISDKGEIRWFETFKAPLMDKQGIVIGTTGYSRDITERKRAEEEHLRYDQQLQQNQKLESLGVLAGGIAHDFNNLLGGIFGYIGLARSTSKDARITEYLEASLATMNRAKALTLQLLTFAKGGAPVQKATPLIPFIQDAAHFALSGSNISCRFFLSEILWQCNIDKNQVGQVIDNIVINAEQAMPGGGSIEIAATNVSFGDKGHPPLAAGDYVKVSIKDFGIGIPKDIMPRIFDPFFSTKTKGHGLGLATCFSIINRHGGCIEVESEQGIGSCFHVYLPASPEPVAANTDAVVTHAGSGTIIVMDDEEVIRSTVGKMLESLGYAAVCKSNGRDAIDFYVAEVKAHRGCAAMIFDLTIPGAMGGIDAVTEIRKMDAGAKVPVFVMSGYADNSVMKNPVEYGFVASISKPFTVDELSEMLQRHLS